MPYYSNYQFSINQVNIKNKENSMFKMDILTFVNDYRVANLSNCFGNYHESIDQSLVTPTCLM